MTKLYSTNGQWFPYDSAHDAAIEYYSENSDIEFYIYSGDGKKQNPGDFFTKSAAECVIDLIGEYEYEQTGLEVGDLQDRVFSEKEIEDLKNYMSSAINSWAKKINLELSGCNIENIRKIRCEAVNGEIEIDDTPSKSVVALNDSTD